MSEIRKYAVSALVRHSGCDTKKDMAKAVKIVSLLSGDAVTKLVKAEKSGVRGGELFKVFMDACDASPKMAAYDRA